MERSAGVSAVLEETCLLDVLSDEVIISLCTHLPGRDVLALGATSRKLHDTIRECTYLWRTLVTDMLGEGLVRLHQTAWAQGHVAGSELAEIDSAVFYRELFEAATECSRMSYANVLRNKAHKSIDRAHAERLTTTTGHTMTALGRLTAVIGGWRPSAHVEGCCLHAFFVDVLGLRLVEPTLHAQSASPQSRIRHAACAIQRPRWVPRGEDEPEMPCVLVLGGCASPPDGSREPIAHGLLSLCVLSVCEENGSLVRWHKAEAVGTAPRGIWHHDCGSYNRGSKVVVFGGDMQESDPEYEHIRERSAAAHVYVLDVEKREWARVQTSGHHPAWRSLHVCATHKSLVDDSEQLLVLGGSDEHVALFSGGDPAPLHAYALDLGSMSWRAAPHGSFTPMPRLRFAAVSAPCLTASGRWPRAGLCGAPSIPWLRARHG